MALSEDFYGTNATKALDPSPANIMAQGLWQGNVKSVFDTIESAVAHQAKDICLGIIPAGANFIGIVVGCESAWGAGVTGTFKLVNTDGTVATISAALDLHTGFGGTFIAGVVGNEVLTTLAKETWVVMTVSNAAVTADKTIQVVSLFTID